MSLREPNRRHSADYSRAFLDQLHRSLQGSAKQAAFFVEICDRVGLTEAGRERAATPQFG